MYDLLIRNASIIDGTGAPAYAGDVAVQNGKLVTHPFGTAAEVIDGTGLTLAPGFIDAHSHADSTLGTEVGLLCKTCQGITTELAGQCGSTRFPFSTDPEKQEFLHQKTSHSCPVILSMADYRAWLNSIPQTTNLAMYVGHSAIRVSAMGFAMRKPTGQELDTMKAMVREAMENGALGMSSGLIYSPGSFADEEELVELCKVVAEYGGTYATHMRNEAGTVLDSVRESIAVAEKAGCKLDISHHKICGKENWNKSIETLELVRQARERGIDVTLDVYPYTASSTDLDICLPMEFFSHGPAGMRRLLADPAVRAELKPTMINGDGRFRHCGGWDGILISSAPQTPNAVNMTVQQYADSIGKDAFEAYFDLVCDNPDAQAVYFSMCDDDLNRIVCDPNSVIGTDGVAQDLSTPTHPRSFGSFPRALRLFVRERGLLTLEQMIHKMTGMTAQRFSLKNKGVIADGMDADLVLFDAHKITDRATYEDGLQQNEGIHAVIVAGQIVYADGKLTGKKPGRFLPHT